MQLTKILIAQAAPEPSSSPYTELAKENSLQIDFHPFISVEPLEMQEVRKQKIDFANFSAVIFTSRATIDYYFNVAQDIHFKVPESMKYFCPTNMIACYLQKYCTYRKRKVFIGENDFNSLIPFFKKNIKEKFLLPSSNAESSKVVQVLNSLSLEWEKIILFRTVSNDFSKINIFYYDILIFFTPSDVKAFLVNFPDFTQKNIIIGAFGESTYQALIDARLEVAIKAPGPLYPSMATALKHYLISRSKMTKTL